MPALLDTCVLVDLLRRNARAEQAVLDFDEPPRVCAVSRMELHAGARSQREQARIDAVLAAFPEVEVAADVFKGAGAFLRHYGKSHGLDIPDALIAATAEHHRLKLATLNVKHFPMFARLKPVY